MLTREALSCCPVRFRSNVVQVMRIIGWGPSESKSEGRVGRH